MSSSNAEPHIAIVDDDESVCRSMGRLLRAAGYVPVSYSSAEEFLENALHLEFDCLVLDIQLGQLSGLELYRRILKAGILTPVIFITAYDDPDAIKQAWAAGCAACFRKSDSGTLVLEAIRHVMP